MQATGDFLCCMLFSAKSGTQFRMKTPFRWETPTAPICTFVPCLIYSHQH